MTLSYRFFLQLSLIGFLLASPSHSYANIAGVKIDITKILTPGTGIINKLLKEAGAPTIDEMKKTMKCVPPLLKQMKDLRKPSPEKVKGILGGACVKEIRLMNDHCNGPGAMVASFLPVGSGVVHFCERVGKVNEKLDQIEALFKEEGEGEQEEHAE